MISGVQQKSESPDTKGKILEVRGLTKRFGGIIANDNIDMDVFVGEIVGLIGPNGAGKSTLFDMVAGVKPSGSKRFPDAGCVRFLGHDITQLKAHQVCRLGLARTFQIVRILEKMSVLENVTVGALCRTSEVYEAEKKAERICEFVGLKDRQNLAAGELTIEGKKRLELARALATEPKLLLLDEVMAGLNPSEVADTLELLRQINRQGITIIIVEHVMQAVMAISDRIVVLDYGKKIADDTPEAVVKDKNVIDAYLGSEDA